MLRIISILFLIFVQTQVQAQDACTSPCVTSFAQCGISATCVSNCSNCPTVKECIKCFENCGANEHQLNCIAAAAEWGFGYCRCMNFLAQCRYTTDAQLDAGGICEISNIAIALIVTVPLTLIICGIFTCVCCHYRRDDYYRYRPLGE